MKVAVAGIIMQNDKVLIGKKIKKSGHFVSGGWHLPGGHLLDGEEEIAGLIREIKEETNLDITVLDKLASHTITEADTKVHWFICETTASKLVAQDDLSDAKFVLKSKVLDECDTRASKSWPKEVLRYLKE